MILHSVEGWSEPVGGSCERVFEGSDRWELEGSTVSLAQIGVDYPGSNEPPSSPGESFDRTPPQDLLAEQSVLGGMMLSKDAIADVVEVVRGADFYRPAHETIFEAVLDIYGRGEPADAVTVADELTKRGDLTRIGGTAYLHTLISGVPTAANAGYYAQIVRERAVLRRLVEAGTRIVQLGYAAGGGDVDDLVNAAQAEVYAVTERRTSEDYLPIGQIIEGTVDEIEAAGHRDGTMAGVPTGFADLDRLTHGLHPGQMIVLAARPAIGKALSLDTPLPTPGGWTTMGTVQVGEEVLGADGRPTRVLAATEVMLDRPCFEVQFSDGSLIVADAQHQWLTETRASRKGEHAARTGYNRTKNQRTFPAVRTTEEIARTLRCDTSEGRLNHSVRNSAALDLPDQDLLVPAYVLGAWLGDGTTDAATLTSADPEIAMRCEAEGVVATRVSAALRYSLRLPVAPIRPRSCVVCGVEFIPQTSQVRTCGRSCGGKAKAVSDPVPAPTCPDCGALSTGLRRCQDCHHRYGTVQGRLRTLGVLGNKHIPESYLRGSIEQRRDLLAGLLDTDGTVAPTGLVQFTSTNPRLASDVRELIVSLGYRCSVSQRHVRGRTVASSTAFTISFSTDDMVFWLERKRLLHKERGVRRFTRRATRFITEVRAIESVPVRCIEVAAVDHLYLAGPTMIPTHNSTLGLDIARSCSIKHGMTSVIFSLEMSRTEITMRLLSAEARIPLQKLRQGKLDDSDWTKMARTMGELTDAPLFIDDSPNMSLMEIRAKCRRLKQRHDLKLVIIDYLQLMQSGKRVESRQQEVSEFSRALKLLAKELEVPVIAISQLNRGAEARTDKKPMMSDLRESGCLTADTKVLRADTGAEVTLGELHAAGARDVPVWSLDDSLRYVRRHLTHVFPTGVKPVFRVTLASGRTVRATANHPFLTYEGWCALEGLRTGSRVAVPRHVPAPEQMTIWDDSRVTAAAETLAEELAGISRTRLGVPSRVASLPKGQIRLFLRHVWSIAGSVSADESAGRGGVHLPGVRRQGLEDVARLLLRFGISTRLGDSGVPSDPGGESVGTPEWALSIDGLDDQRRFLGEIGVHGADSLDAMGLLDTVRAATAPKRSTEVASQRIWDSVHEVLSLEEADFALAGVGAGGGVGAGVGAGGLQLRRQPMGRVAELLDAADLDVEAVNDLLWDVVVAVEPAGVEPVFDATVMGTHNFIADGIAVHNSIEQDADMVILLHREDAYERESPRAGEADFIVAKHRNGPTDTITVAFQGHYSRFVDMAAT
jgi:replicative DNA helicase